MNNYEYHKATIRRGVAAIEKIKYELGDAELQKKRTNEFIRKKMSEEIIDTLAYQNAKKTAIELRRFKDLPAWIDTEAQKKILIEIGNRPELKKNVILGKDYLEIQCSLGIKKLSSKLVDETKAQEIIHKTPGLERGENVLRREKDGKIYIYFTIDGIKRIAKNATYKIPTSDDRKAIGGALSGVKRMETDAHRERVGLLMNYDNAGVLTCRSGKRGEDAGEVDKGFQNSTCLWSSRTNGKSDSYAIRLTSTLGSSYENSLIHMPAHQYARSLVLLVD